MPNMPIDNEIHYAFCKGETGFYVLLQEKGSAKITRYEAPDLPTLRAYMDTRKEARPANYVNESLPDFGVSRDDKTLYYAIKKVSDTEYRMLKRQGCRLRLGMTGTTSREGLMHFAEWQAKKEGLTLQEIADWNEV